MQAQSASQDMSTRECTLMFLDNLSKTDLKVLIKMSYLTVKISSN